MSVQDLKVLIVSSEVSPYAKSGGLGDVIGSLPKELKKLSVDVRVVLPKYKTIKEQYLKNLTYLNNVQIFLGWRNQNANILQMDSEIPTYLIENDYYFGRDGFYGYWDDYERFAFFSKAVIEILDVINFKPDIIHFNDWQTGPAVVYLKEIYSKFVFYSEMKTLFTIHNLQYQGVFGQEILSTLDLPAYFFSPDKMEFYGKVNYLKSGILYSDAVSTVSETYANEIQTSSYSYGLDGLLSSRKDNLYGIINGIDYELNNPETDTRIFENYSKDTLYKKKNNKLALQERLNLPKWEVPVISIISRLADQKGFDILAICLEELMQKDLQLVILGTGDHTYENMFRDMAWRYPERLSANICFDEELAQKIYAGSDMFLMPSVFEPCGLGQLLAMRYGTIPIARKTGGLNDTIQHYDANSKTGNGFLFEDYVASGMMWAVNEALNVYSQGEKVWNQLVTNAMESDFSWEKSAEKYVNLYKKLKQS